MASGLPHQRLSLGYSSQEDPEENKLTALMLCVFPFQTTPPPPAPS